MSLFTNHKSREPDVFKPGRWKAWPAEGITRKERERLIAVMLKGAHYTWTNGELLVRTKLRDEYVIVRCRMVSYREIK